MVLSNRHELGEVLYTKFVLYEMAWGKISLQGETKVCGAPMGGPIAVVQEHSKMVNKEGSKKSICIYSSSGRFLSEIDVNGINLIGMGWNDIEQLIVISGSGDGRVFDIGGKIAMSFRLYDKVYSTNILDCVIWGSGVAARTADSVIHVAEGLATGSPPRCYQIDSKFLGEVKFTAMAVISPLLSRTGLLEVLVATSDNTVVVMSENSCEDQQLRDRIAAPVVKIAVSPNGRFLACYRRDGVLSVFSSNFSTKVLDFDTKTTTPPSEVVWCGDDSVAMCWRGTGLVLVGPYGDWLNFATDDPLFLIPETDCLRVISATSCDMLLRVSEATEAVFNVGSTHGAALLFDAMQAYEDGDARSDENIRALEATNQLTQAVDACVSAAAAQFDVKQQQLLLRAASYGKAFCASYDPREFVDTARKLRVLNDVRRPEVGLPLTMKQLDRLTPDILGNRLALRGYHYLALSICEYMGLKAGRILVHWAGEKVKRLAATSMSDEEVLQYLRQKLQSFEKISYLEVANAAYESGRRRLATLILDQEQNSAMQVPLLLAMNEDELALQKAVNSEDPDLMYLTLFHIERGRREGDGERFLRTVSVHPEATTLLKNYYRVKMTAMDRAPLHNLIMWGKNYLEAGNAAVAHAQMQVVFARKVQLLKEASTLYQQGRDLALLKSLTDEQVELLNVQRALEQKTGRELMDRSVCHTLNALVSLSIESAPAEAGKWMAEFGRVAKLFKVSEKSCHSIRLNAYCVEGQWELVSRLAAEKKSPIGYRPFAVTCLRHGQPPAEVEKYVERMSSLEDKYDMYCEMGLWRKAGDIAVKLKDSAKIVEVQRMCKDAHLEHQLQEHLDRK